MKGFDTLKLKSAVKALNQFDLSFDHLTTMDFGQIMPVCAKEMIPRDKFQVDGNYFSRMAPLVTPTYGKFSFKTLAGFVPYHQVADDAEAYIDGKTVWEGHTPTNRYFTFDDLDTFIRNYCVTSTGATASNSVYHYVTASGNGYDYIYDDIAKPKGKYFAKILNCLGYAFPQGVDARSASTWSAQVKNAKLSAYPLLCFAKLYNDYMSMSTRFNTSALSTFLFNVKHGIADATNWDSSSGHINSTGMYLILSNILLNYDSDYFTTAWQTPNNAINYQENISSVNVPISASSTRVVVSDVYDVHHNAPVASSIASLSQRALDFLRSFELWVKRNNYSGSKPVQQLFSRFGIKTDDYRCNYAHIISKDILPVQVGDVTATADSGGVVLGEYAGKGIMNGSKTISYESNDYGYLFILGYFTVKPMNAYGFDRSVLRVAPLDFYTPEFDGLGADAITLGEVYTNPISSTDTTLDTQIFGFTERYNSYRFSRDLITGDFRNAHPDNPINAWHTGRNLNDIRAAGALVAQSSSMNTLAASSSEYNRLFNVTSSNEDHFYLICQFKINAMRPMLNLNQVVGLGVGDTVVSRNGSEIS